MLKIGDTVRQKPIGKIFKQYGYLKDLENFVGVIHCFYRGNNMYVGVDFKFVNGHLFHRLDNTLSEPTGRWYHINEVEALREFNDDEWE